MSKNLAINLSVVFTAVVGGFLFAMGPWRCLVAQRVTTTQQVSAMKKSESGQETLLREVARAKSSIGHEELARKHGYLAEHEKLANP